MAPLRSLPISFASRVVLGACLCTLLAGPLAAQVNVEALRRDDPPLGRSGSLGSTLSVRTGNVDFVQIGFDARLYDVTTSATRLIVGDGGLGLLGGSRFSSSGLLHYRVTFTPRRGVSPEWYAQLNYDRPQLLSLRALAGAGARTSFARGAWGQFGAGSSLMVEHERLSLPDTALHPERTTVARLSNFLTLRVVPSDNMVITSTTYYQPDFRSFSDTRLLENLRIATSVTEALALTVSFDLRYDSKPPDGIASLDTNLRTGLTFTY